MSAHVEMCFRILYIQKVGDAGAAREQVHPLSPLRLLFRSRVKRAPTPAPLILINARRLMQIGLKYLSERQTGSNSLAATLRLDNLPFAAADFVIFKQQDVYGE